MSEPTETGWLAESTDPERQYRTVEPLAVVALVAGLVSPLALIAPVWWLVPALAVVLSLLALARIKRDPDRSGRIAALVGLVLAVTFGVAPIAQHFSTRMMLSSQARPVADQFFEYLRERSPEKAFMLRYIPDQRRPMDERLWTYYRADNEAKQLLREFVDRPVVRTLLELGPRADIRYYRTRGVTGEAWRGLVSDWYTVTYDDEDGQKKTFVVGIVLERAPTKTPGLSPWRVHDIHDVVDLGPQA